jgi:hypothetical protein
MLIFGIFSDVKADGLYAGIRPGIIDVRFLSGSGNCPGNDRQMPFPLKTPAVHAELRGL